MLRPPVARRRSAARIAFATIAALAACTWSAAAPADDLLLQARAHDAQLEAREALAAYLEVEKQQPDNADVCVGIARQYRHLMVDASSPVEKLKLGNLAVAYGRKAAKLAPSNSDAQLSCAISYGKMVPLLGNKEQVAVSHLVKQGAERAIKLNGRNDLAWHILGRWHRNVANVSSVKRALSSVIYDKLPDATNEEAVRCLETAVRINPKRLMHHIELGRAYAQMGREADARRTLQTGLSMPVVEKDDASMKALGRETLKTL